MNTLNALKIELAQTVSDMAETIRAYNPSLADLFVSNVFQRENIARAFIAGFSSENGVTKLITMQIRLIQILKIKIKQEA